MKRTVASVLLGLSLLFTPLTFNYSQAAAAGITAGQDVNQGKQQQLENLKQKKQGLDQRLIELQTKVDNYHEKRRRKLRHRRKLLIWRKNCSNWKRS